MREILFRGKTYKGDWIEGNFIDWGNHVQVYIFPLLDFATSYDLGASIRMYAQAVIPETVGQFTGLTDKNGKKIFEGDIVVTRYPKGDICSIGDVQFDSGVFGVEWTVHKKNKGMVGSWGQSHNLRRFDDDIINHIEVIGNIHDNRLGDF